MRVNKLGLPPYQECHKDKIVEDKRGIADAGYLGGARLALPNANDPKELHKFKSRAQCRHKTFNGRIKNFAILQGTFCHSIPKHCIAFHAVCVIVQYQMDNGAELFTV